MKKLVLMLAMVLPMLAIAQKNAVPAQVIGHVNSQEIMALMPEVNKMAAVLDSLEGVYENQYANMQEEFNKKVVEFQKESSTMTPGVRDIRQQELAQMDQRIKSFLQIIQQDLQNKQAELMKPIQQRLLDAIGKVAAAKGCTYVVESLQLLYTAPSALNLTADVKAELGIK